MSPLKKAGMLCILLITGTASIQAEYYSYKDMVVEGPLQGQAGEPFLWLEQDGQWEQGMGYAWPEKDAVMKWSFETARDLTFSVSLPNGTYAVKVCDVFNSEKAENQSEYVFTVNGAERKVVTAPEDPVPGEYDLGQVVVTDGQLVIGVGNPTSQQHAWLGFSGFDITAVPGGTKP